jgi:hypothetical protein
MPKANDQSSVGHFFGRATHLFRAIAGRIRRQMEMPSAHQGSRLGQMYGRAAFHVRRELRLLGRRIGERSDPELTRRFVAFQRHVERRELEAARAAAQEIAAGASEKGDARLLRRLGKALDRLGDHGESARLKFAASVLAKGDGHPQWTGQDISGRILLLDLWKHSAKDQKQALGPTIRCARLVGQAAPCAGRCIVLVEPRLVPLLQRTFPGVDARPGGIADESAYAEADFVAMNAHLTALFAPNAERIAATFTPLLADPNLVRQFRAKYYAPDGRPLIGISWASKTYVKAVPGLADWAECLSSLNARFVSLQYGGIAADLRKLREAGADILHDESVDQIKDMDRFAAQISALDGVISISNTAAHLTGALGVPAIYVIDDKFHRGWRIDPPPWYPRARIVIRNGRPWRDVLTEVKLRFSIMFPSAPSGRPSR